jgi:uncharacterized MAPEG superfamily protein
LANRAGEALRNESENSPAFLAIALGYVLLGGEPQPLLYVSAAYIAARYFQGYAQYRALQPHRMTGYLIGVIATLSLTVMTALHIKI